MRVTVLGGVRVDRHAADGIEHRACRRGAVIVMVVSAVRHVAMLSLETYTP
jgi:hypothetical protein